MSTGFVVVIARKPEMQLRAAGAGQETGKESGSRGSCEDEVGAKGRELHLRPRLRGMDLREIGEVRRGRNE